MITAFNFVAIPFIAAVVVFGVAVIRAHRVTARERREDRDRLRTGDALARSFVASKNAGYVQRPEWGKAPAYPKHPAPRKERP